MDSVKELVIDKMGVAKVPTKGAGMATLTDVGHGQISGYVRGNNRTWWYADGKHNTGSAIFDIEETVAQEYFNRRMADNVNG